jgi:hypothetical protein
VTFSIKSSGDANGEHSARADAQPTPRRQRHHETGIV